VDWNFLFVNILNGVVYGSFLLLGGRLQPRQPRPVAMALFRGSVPALSCRTTSRHVSAIDVRERTAAQSQGCRGSKDCRQKT
jgi:hypothetical protein